MTAKRFPAVTSKEVIRVLEKIGFRFVRQSGSSHAVYKRAADRKRTIVPIHSGKVIKRKTLRAILKDADLTVDAFNDLRK
jgi:predicted RNA binding protein YcfA (HicA-like mRNA interferase family)